MKVLLNAAKYRSLPVFLGVALCLAASGFKATAQIVTLTDNNAVAKVNTGSQAGMFNWTVDNQNYLAQQWFWYRVGSAGPEHSIDTISAPTISSSSARQLTTTYTTNFLNTRVDYLLTGSTPGSGSSSIQESITINNTSGSNMVLHFFQYSDFDLGPGGDTVQLGTDIHGKFNEALQSNAGIRFSESVVSPGADRGEANLFPSTLNSLNDGLPTTLSNATTAGPGDATWAFQWDLTIVNGGSAVISKIKNLDVPEPSCVALGSLALGVLALRRRRC